MNELKVSYLRDHFFGYQFYLFKIGASVSSYFKPNYISFGFTPTFRTYLPSRFYTELMFNMDTQFLAVKKMFSMLLHILSPFIIISVVEDGFLEIDIEIYKYDF